MAERARRDLLVIEAAMELVEIETATSMSDPVPFSRWRERYGAGGIAQEAGEVMARTLYPRARHDAEMLVPPPLPNFLVLPERVGPEEEFAQLWDRARAAARRLREDAEFRAEVAGLLDDGLFARTAERAHGWARATEEEGGGSSAQAVALWVYAEAAEKIEDFLATALEESGR